MTAPRKREAHAKVTDTRNHALTVFDGADRVGSLVERAGKFEAFDIEGRHLGTFPDLRAASRAIPATHFGVTGAPLVPKVCRGVRRG